MTTCMIPEYVYSDKSGLNDKIGTAAILYHPNGSTQTLRYHLGSADQHTVYKSEAVGLLLAANLILNEPDIDIPHIYLRRQPGGNKIQ